MTRLFSGCKLNLSLRILGRREDGYHNLDSIFLPLKYPRDTLDLAPGSGGRLELQCSAPIAGKNILLKTWELFCDIAKVKIGVKVRLHKRVPQGAGLGGASGNAAVFLLWLNKFNPAPLNSIELTRAAAKIGADVPFFLVNKTCRIEGIGERATVLPQLQRPFWIVLVWPEIVINTAWAFSVFDAVAPDLTNSKNGDNGKRAAQHDSWGWQNDLEMAVFPHFPILGEIKRLLCESGADHAAMSGSGSSVYGLFYNQLIARDAAVRMRQRFRYVYFLPGLPE